MKSYGYTPNEDVILLVEDKPAFDTFAGSYALLDSLKDSGPLQTQQDFYRASYAFNAFPLLAEAVRFDAGQVTFGTPTIYSSKEKDLVIPKSISSQSDVYWIEFAMSFRSGHMDRFQEISFGVTTSDEEIIALELIPLRFEKEIAVKRTLSTPTIKAQVGPQAVELGKIFEQQVVFKSLKPTIIASGLQESEFSWSLRDDAVQSGARRFVAVVKVPQKKRSVTLQIQASAKMKVPWPFQGNVVATKPRLVLMQLK